MAFDGNGIIEKGKSRRFVIERKLDKYQTQQDAQVRSRGRNKEMSYGRNKNYK